MQSQKNNKTTCLLLALTTIFWGSLYTASKVLLDVIQPFTLLCLRYIIAAIAMTILQRCANRPERKAAQDQGR